MHVFRIQYLSNLFLGTTKSILKNPAKQIQPSAPYLALLGNIGRAGCSETKEFLGWAESKFQRIYWVPGPLEYSSISQTWRQRADATYSFLQSAGFKKTIFCQKYQEPLTNGVLLATPTWHLGFSAEFQGQLHDWSPYGSQIGLDMKQIFDLQMDETNWILQNSAKKSSSVFLLTHSPINYVLLENQNILFHLYGTGYETNAQSVCGGMNPWVGINSATSDYFRPDGFMEFKTSVPKYS